MLFLASWLRIGWDVFRGRGLESDWWEEACLIQFFTLTCTARSFRLRTWMNVVNNGVMCLTCLRLLKFCRRDRADYVFEHRENEDSSFSLSSVCLFQCDSSTETQQTVTIMCQTVSNTNSVAFTLGMHDISATISVSADKCPFFLLSVSAW